MDLMGSLIDPDAPVPKAPIRTPVPSVINPGAFVCNITGVLVRGSKPISRALGASKILNRANQYGVEVLVGCARLF